MRFWDTSAVVPLLVEEEESAVVRALLSSDPEVAAWWGTPIECASAVARLRREEVLGMADEERVLDLLRAFRSGWVEVLPSGDVGERAMRLLRVHPLRAADALQLAAAQVWAAPGGRAELVTFDERLARAARLEGFRVLGAD